MSASFDRLLPRVSIACAMVALVLSGFGAQQLHMLYPVVLEFHCHLHATYFVSPGGIKVFAIAAAGALAVGAVLAERIAKSDHRRIHACYWVALLGFLLSVAIWVSAAASLMLVSPSACPSM